MKIPLQQKIAELESRIAALEKGAKSHSRITREFMFPYEPKWREHWDRLWKEFDELMKSAFSRF